METIHWTPIYREDLAIGNSTADVRLQDGSVETLHEINLGGLLTVRTRSVTLTAGASVSLSAMMLAGERIFGVTMKNTSALGASSGLTGVAIGDGTLVDRWGTQTTLTNGATTGPANFLNGDVPIYATDTAVILSAIGGNFDGTGTVDVQVHAFLLAHRS